MMWPLFGGRCQSQTCCLSSGCPSPAEGGTPARPLQAPRSHRGAHGGIALGSLSWPRLCRGDSSLVFAPDSAL